MAEYKVGSLVRSLAGHDKDQRLTEAIESSRPTVDEEIRLFIKKWKKEREI